MSGHVITICGSARARTSLRQSYGIWSRSSLVDGLAPRCTCFQITAHLRYRLGVAVPSLLNR